MDHFKVLKRAWEITWRYRALWVFGIILALTTSRGGRGSGNNGVQYTFGSEDFPFRGGKFSIPEISPPQVSAEITGTLIAIGIGLACLILLLIVVTVVARYVARTALIRMVDDHEETGQKRGVRQGFRMGWSRAAWRLFLIDLVVGVPLVLAFILLFLLALAPLLLWTTGSRPAGVVGTVATIGLFFLFLFLLIIVALVVTLLMHFFRRACALEGLGVIESIRHGFDVVREHLKDVAIMWLIMIGVSIGLALAMIFVVLLLVVLGVLLGGLPALLVGGLASQAFPGAVPWILGAAIGIPIFLLVVVVPMLFLGGLAEVFKSSVWTLTYRELRALEVMEPEPSVA
jgi:hypothetical protein